VEPESSPDHYVVDHQIIKILRSGYANFEYLYLDNLSSQYKRDYRCVLRLTFLSSSVSYMFICLSEHPGFKGFKSYLIL
jgi:hypothetical protein